MTRRHCEKLFFPPPTDFEMGAARWCDECQRYHPVRNGQGWLFSTGSLLFSKRKFYVAEYDKVSPSQLPCLLASRWCPVTISCRLIRCEYALVCVVTPSLYAINSSSQQDVIKSIGKGFCHPGVGRNRVR